jgi:hypothetical protein
MHLEVESIKNIFNEARDVSGICNEILFSFVESVHQTFRPALKRRIENPRENFPGITAKSF